MEEGESTILVEGFPKFYMPPEPNYDAPDDPATFLHVTYMQPYRVASLEMDQWDSLLNRCLRIKPFNSIRFPETHLNSTFGLTGWAPARKH